MATCTRCAAARLPAYPRLSALPFTLSGAAATASARAQVMNRSLHHARAHDDMVQAARAVARAKAEAHWEWMTPVVQHDWIKHMLKMSDEALHWAHKNNQLPQHEEEGVDDLHHAHLQRSPDYYALKARPAGPCAGHLGRPAAGIRLGRPPAGA